MKYALIACLLFGIQDSFCQLEAVETVEGIEISEGGIPVMFYQKSPKSLNGMYERAGYVHPLYNLDGVPITEDFPADHFHHHGIFWAWHQMIYNGESIGDSWDGRHISWETLKTVLKKNAGYLSLTSDVAWTSNIHDKSLPLFEEKTKITIYHKTDDFRIIDFMIRLKPKGNKLQLGGSDDAKGYGGFSLRFRNPETLTFMSGGNEIAPDVNAVTAGPWMDFSGSFGLSGRSGVAVFCHPSNPGDIRQWILRDSKSMQNPVWPGREPVAIPRKGIELKYRLIIHDGRLDQAELEEQYQEFKSK